jgi:hypothetical protein
LLLSKKYHGRKKLHANKIPTLLIIFIQENNFKPKNKSFQNALIIVHILSKQKQNQEMNAKRIEETSLTPPEVAVP